MYVPAGNWTSRAAEMGTKALWDRDALMGTVMLLSKEGVSVL
jgi:hypothetical protein